MKKKKLEKKKHKNHEQQTKIQEIYERKQTNKIEKKKVRSRKKYLVKWYMLLSFLAT
jgi:hypothetical protein